MSNGLVLHKSTLLVSHEFKNAFATKWNRTRWVGTVAARQRAVLGHRLEIRRLSRFVRAPDWLTPHISNGRPVNVAIRFASAIFVFWCRLRCHRSSVIEAKTNSEKCLDYDGVLGAWDAIVRVVSVTLRSISIFRNVHNRIIGCYSYCCRVLTRNAINLYGFIYSLLDEPLNVCASHNARGHNNSKWMPSDGCAGIQSHRDIINQYFSYENEQLRQCSRALCRRALIETFVAAISPFKLKCTSIWIRVWKGSNWFVAEYRIVQCFDLCWMGALVCVVTSKNQ